MGGRPISWPPEGVGAHSKTVLVVKSKRKRGKSECRAFAFLANKNVRLAADEDGGLCWTRTSDPYRVKVVL